jgi:3-methyl-2-oxobutanoate hydroxymethyltransferase
VYNFLNSSFIIPDSMKLTPLKIQSLKTEGKKIVMLTVYDFPSARIADEAGIDILLVGDSLGNVVQGKESTLPVTLNEMIYHGEIVARAAKNGLVVVDLPFPYCQLGASAAVRAAAKVMKKTGADAVKIEGGEKRAETVAALVEAGIPVVGHCGLMPQNIRLTGSFFLQRQREQVLNDALAIEQAGAFCLVLECCVADIAAEVSQNLKIPTIGIGSGAQCDGQVLVFHDILGYKPPEETRVPKHAKQYADLRSVISEAVKSYAEEVRTAQFPPKHH